MRWGCSFHFVDTATASNGNKSEHVLYPWVQNMNERKQKLVVLLGRHILYVIINDEYKCKDLWLQELQNQYYVFCYRHQENLKIKFY